MSPVSINIVQTTFEKFVKPNSDAISDVFYSKLFELDPALRPMFKEDLSAQKRSMMQMLEVTIKGLHKPETIILAI